MKSSGRTHRSLHPPSRRFVVVDKKGVVRASMDSDEPTMNTKLMRAVKKTFTRIGPSFFARMNITDLL